MTRVSLFCVSGARTRVCLLALVSLVLSLPHGRSAEPAASPAPETKPPRWSISESGAIVWDVHARDTHQDNIEMSGERVSVILTYGVSPPAKLTVSRQVIWPMLRFLPNKTRDHLTLVFGQDAEPGVFIDGAAPRAEELKRVEHNGTTHFEGTYGRDREIVFQRVVFPSTTEPAVIDLTTLTNRSSREIRIEVEPNERVVRTLAVRGIYGAYVASARVVGTGERLLAPGANTTYAIIFSAKKANEPDQALNLEKEHAARRERLRAFAERLQLTTPDPVLNTAFAFAKIRAQESIFRTAGGLMHAPGGGAYYAAIWANDQAEYANPLFAMTGDPIAAESALNAFRHFARFMNPEYRPIPSSIIAEGAGVWHGAKDRGDMAMIAYGATRFALAYGDRQTAEELWPLIEWCLEYSRRKLDQNGVVTSDSDELENRFPAGKANLCTSSLHYDALRSAIFLGHDLGRPAPQLARYEAEATALRAAIERYFGATVEGFETYRYFDRADLQAHPKFGQMAGTPDVLRAWICIPLTVDIHDRAPGTIAALFSPRLWTDDGLATQAGEPTFWDRSTLYALRGVFAAGATQQALDYLSFYSRRRLLGDHVPYPVEAYPEGNQRHLSAESALYCRVFTEGLFGLRPTGLRSFNVTPRLPKDWPNMSLRRVHAFGTVFDLTVKRDELQLQLAVHRDGKPLKTIALVEGSTVPIDFHETP